MEKPLHRNLFIVLYAGGGLAGAAGMVLWQGLPFFGVGLPFGIMLGLIAYLTVHALFFSHTEAIRPEDWRTIALAGLVAAVMAHFTEVHFGIAVAVSRTFFWLYAALLVVAGLGLIIPAEIAGKEKEKERERGRRKRATTARPTSSFLFPPSFILASLLVILGFTFINNPDRLTSAGEIIWRSFTTLPTQAGRVSYGILLTLLSTWLMGGVLFASENSRPARWGARAAEFGLTLGASLIVASIYWLWQGSELANLVKLSPQSDADLFAAVGRVTGLLTNLYVALVALMLALAVFLPDDWPLPLRRPDVTSTALAGLLAVSAVIAAYTTNLRIVQADVVYKTGEGWAAAENWPGATRLYLLASALAPNEDYYYLFVGKGFLEIADRAKDATEQAAVFDEAERRLREAQALNPLNTDHTANLGRLHRWWASVAPDEAELRQRAQTAGAYYERATTLSPNNVGLWVEWASLDLAFLDDRAGTLDKLNHAIALDPKYNRAYALLGDYHVTLARGTGDAAARASEYALAAGAYEKAVMLVKDEKGKQREAMSGYIGLGAVYSATGDTSQAIDSYLQAVSLAPPAANLTNLYQALAELYRRAGSKSDALRYAQLALADAPEEMKPGIEEMIEELNAGG